MIEVRQTSEFAEWLRSLKDVRARARIQIRLERLALGLFGDAKFFDGIGELRVDYGPGYRVYIRKQGATVVVLLCGGDKSTQSKDIKKAIKMAEELE